MSDRTLQYQSSGVLNYKVLGDKEFLSKASKGQLLPLHAQLSPTNKCNMNCSFCSYADCDRNLELSLKEIKVIVDKSKSIGMKAIDITGGGEPLVHPEIDNIINYITSCEIRCGLTTNGSLIDRPQTLDQLIWLRFSCSDDYTISTKFMDKIIKSRATAPHCDWSMNYVISENFSPSNFKKAIDLGVKSNCSHIRVFGRVSVHSGDDEINMSPIQEEISKMNIKGMTIIVQDRGKYSSGEDCYAGYVRPRIEADGYIYACCGGQHAIRGRQEKSMPKELRLSKAIDINKFPEMSCKPFDGRICSRCYFSDFNKLLKSIMNPDQLHKEFI